MSQPAVRNAVTVTYTWHVSQVYFKKSFEISLETSEYNTVKLCQVYLK